MAYGVGVGLVILAVIVATGAAVQVSLYRRGMHIITRAQFVLRMITAALLLLVIGMIFWGAVHTWANPVHGLLYLTGTILLALAVPVLALLDLARVRATRDLREAELYLRAAAEAAKLQRDRQQEPGNGQ